MAGFYGAAAGALRPRRRRDCGAGSGYSGSKRSAGPPAGDSGVRRRRVAQVLVGALGGDAAARGALQEALLQEVGLVEILDRPAVLAHRRGDRLDPRRAAAVDLDQHREDPPVELVEAEVVHLEERQRLLRHREVDPRGVRVDLGEVAHPAQQPVGDARRAAAPARELVEAGGVGGDPEDLRRALDDARQLLGRIEIEPVDDAEARAQRRRDEPRPRRRADQGEARQVDLDDARRRTLADDEVELEVLEGRVEDLLDRRPEAVDLVHEQDVPRLQVGEDRRQIPGALEHRPGGGAQRRIHLLGQDVRQRRLAEPGRSEEQHMVERLAAFAAPRG